MKSKGFIVFWLMSIFVLLLPFVVLVSSYVIVQNNSEYIVDTPEAAKVALQQHPRTAVVFGSGLYPGGEPRPVLAARLDAATALFQNGVVERIIVSGHVEPYYDEPRAMKAYLVAHGVPHAEILPDGQGDNTYATCAHAKHDFGTDEAILVSQASHLPRAIYLCRAQDITAYGFAAAPASSRASQAFQWLRESGGNVRAVFDVLTGGWTRYN